ncbi:MAG TPA: ASPIC/UnbV domain-containing protein, partial [Armatimonadota bacterium]|nr:ASPIC/UnbV domain-containing protein [Armatimonadota bacterium]
PPRAGLRTGVFVDRVRDLGDMAIPHVTRGLATGDYDNDGRIDVLCNNLNGPATLYHNESPDRNSWISIRLEGVKCNRDAIGARVTLSAGGRQQVREIQTGRGYLSASDPRALFGVGKNTKIQSLQIRWPDGRSQTVTLPGIDRYLTIREG